MAERDLQDDILQEKQRAFESVKKKLNSQADLETLGTKKQAAIVSHSDKLGRLTTIVQGITKNIGKGLNELSSTSLRLNALLAEMDEIKDKCKEPTAHMAHYNDMKDLARVLERLYIVDTLQKRFVECEEMIEDVRNFIDTHENDISISCFRIICSLLDFEKELQLHAKKSVNLTFIDEKFSPVREALEIMKRNAQIIISSAFSNEPDTPEITTDLLARAIWIILTNSVRNGEASAEVVTALLTNSIIQQFPQVDENSVNKIDFFLKQLQEVLDSLTERLDIIIPALPEGINIMDIITVLANEQVITILDQIVSTSKTSFILSRIILWMRDYMSSMSHMLGVNPSDALKSKLNQFMEDLKWQIPNDMGGFLQKILDMENDSSSIEKSRDGILTTPCPYDFQKRLVESHQIAVQTDIPELCSEIDDNLMTKFLMMTRKINDIVSLSYNNDYVVAAINNSLNAVKVSNSLVTQLPTVVKEVDATALKTEWSQIQRNGITRLIYLIISNACEGEGWDLRPDFTSKFTNVSETVATIKKQMLPPLFRKFINQFCHQFVAYYMVVYKVPYPEDKKPEPDAIISNVTSDTEVLIQWVEEIAGSAATWVKPLQQAILGFQRFITGDSKFIISNVGPIISCFSDFTVDLIKKINDMKPNSSKLDSSSLESIDTVYKDNTKDASQMKYIDPILEKFPDSTLTIGKLIKNKSKTLM